MARHRRKEFYCSIHGGPFFGRGWGGHLSRGCKGMRMTKEEKYMELLDAPKGRGRGKSRGILDPMVKTLHKQLAEIGRQVLVYTQKIEALKATRKALADAITGLEAV